MEEVQEPRISPDGKQIVYSRRWIDKLNDKWESALWIMDADGSRNRFLAKGSSPRWSPDGTRVAYLAEGEPKGTQLFVRWMDGEGTVSQITRVEKTPGGIAFTVEDQGTRNLYFAPLQGPARQVTQGKHVLSVTDLNPSGQAVGTLTSYHQPGDVVTFPRGSSGYGSAFGNAIKNAYRAAACGQSSTTT